MNRDGIRNANIGSDGSASIICRKTCQREKYCFKQNCFACETTNKVLCMNKMQVLAYDYIVIQGTESPFR